MGCHHDDPRLLLPSRRQQHGAHRFLCELAFWHEKHPLQAGGVKNESVSRHYRADQNWTVGLLARSTRCLATGATGEEVKKEMYDAIEFHLEGLRLEVNPFRCHGGKRRIARSS